MPKRPSKSVTKVELDRSLISSDTGQPVEEVPAKNSSIHQVISKGMLGHPAVQADVAEYDRLGVSNAQDVVCSWSCKYPVCIYGSYISFWNLFTTRYLSMPEQYTGQYRPGQSPRYSALAIAGQRRGGRALQLSMSL